jgi:hypothetical protein
MPRADGDGVAGAARDGDPLPVEVEGQARPGLRERKVMPAAARAIDSEPGDGSAAPAVGATSANATTPATTPLLPRSGIPDAPSQAASQEGGARAYFCNPAR